jgi:hypothetical protein
MWLTLIHLVSSFCFHLLHSPRAHLLRIDRPIDHQVLLPLVNIPMLEYTLESLAATGVREILVVCCAHAEQIDAYLKSSSWPSRAPHVRVHTITVEDAFSAGDALRRVHQLSLVRSDPFILISGTRFIIYHSALLTIRFGSCFFSFSFSMFFLQKHGIVIVA